MATDPNDVAHLLRRAGFVGTPSQITSLAALNIDQVVAQVLDTSANPGVTMPPSVGNDAVEKYVQFTDMGHWWFDRMASTPTPIVEKMTLFWHGHFTTSLSKVYEPDHIWHQHVLYRTAGLGNYRDLAQAMAIEPAMVLYLDNADSYKRSPNQNFARELMELFLLGVGNYDEGDVAAAAAAWTGYSYNWDTRQYEYKPDWHDNGNKTFFGTTKNWNGPGIIDEIFASKGTIVAKHIARKLWEFFAYQNPSQAIIDALAAVLVNGNWIKAVLSALFQRAEFYSATAKQGRVRSPIEYVVAVLKGLQVPSADLHPEWFMEGMGQELWDPPDVSGWKLNKYWVSTSMLYAKARFAESSSWTLNDKNHHPFANAASMSPTDLAQRGFDLFGITTPMPTTRTVLVNWATAQKAAGQAWVQPHNFMILSMLMPDLMMA
jgi:uncharacterized protein (DUF1800 family)